METHKAIEVFVEAEAGAFVKRQYDEKTLEFKGVRQTSLPYPFPYGFILNTETEDGDGIDAYILTLDALKAGQSFSCQAVGMLEVFEGDEVDHKVLACLLDQVVEIDGNLISTLKNFISGIFKDVPEVRISFGRTLLSAETFTYIDKMTVD